MGIDQIKARRQPTDWQTDPPIPQARIVDKSATADFPEDDLPSGQTEVIQAPESNTLAKDLTIAVGLGILAGFLALKAIQDQDFILSLPVVPVGYLSGKHFLRASKPILFHTTDAVLSNLGRSLDSAVNIYQSFTRLFSHTKAALKGQTRPARERSPLGAEMKNKLAEINQAARNYLNDSIVRLASKLISPVDRRFKNQEETIQKLLHDLKISNKQLIYFQELARENRDLSTEVLATRAVVINLLVGDYGLSLDEAEKWLKQQTDYTRKSIVAGLASLSNDYN